MSEQTMARTISNEWAIEVAKRMQGAKFPMNEEQVSELLEGLEVGDTHCSDLLKGMNYPVDNPVDLLHEISKQTCLNQCPQEETWTVKVTEAMRYLKFPLSKEEALKDLHGIKIEGRDISLVLGDIEYPVETPAELLLKLAEKA